MYKFKILLMIILIIILSNLHTHISINFEQASPGLKGASDAARKMKAIEGMQPQINDMERRLGIMQSVEPVLENAIKTLQKVVDVRGMGKK